MWFPTEGAERGASRARARWGLPPQTGAFRSSRTPPSSARTAPAPTGPSRTADPSSRRCNWWEGTWEEKRMPQHTITTGHSWRSCSPQVLCKYPFESGITHIWKPDKMPNSVSGSHKMGWGWKVLFWWVKGVLLGDKCRIFPAWRGQMAPPTGKQGV